VEPVPFRRSGLRHRVVRHPGRRPLHAPPDREGGRQGAGRDDDVGSRVSPSAPPGQRHAKPVGSDVPSAPLRP